MKRRRNGFLTLHSPLIIYRNFAPVNPESLLLLKMKAPPVITARGQEIK
jgi:hypothetical protein